MKDGPAERISMKYRMVAMAVGPTPSQTTAVTDDPVGANVHGWSSHNATGTTVTAAISSVVAADTRTSPLMISRVSTLCSA